MDPFFLSVIVSVIVMILTQCFTRKKTATPAPAGVLLQEGDTIIKPPRFRSQPIKNTPRSQVRARIRKYSPGQKEPVFEAAIPAQYDKESQRFIAANNIDIVLDHDRHILIDFVDEKDQPIIAAENGDIQPRDPIRELPSDRQISLQRVDPELHKLALTVGEPGSGKSSLINSLANMFCHAINHQQDAQADELRDNDYTEYRAAGNLARRDIGVTRGIYPTFVEQRNEAGRVIGHDHRFAVVDCPGFDLNASDEHLAVVADATMLGRIPWQRDFDTFAQLVQLAAGATEDDEDEARAISCSMVVVSASNLEADLNNLHRLHGALLNHHPTVVITAIDELLDGPDSWHRLYSDGRVISAMDLVAERLGVTRDQIFPVINLRAQRLRGTPYIVRHNLMADLCNTLLSRCRDWDRRRMQNEAVGDAGGPATEM